MRFITDCRTSSRGPMALIRPLSMIATRSTLPSAAGRWVITMTMPPRWRLVSGAVEARVRLVEHDEEGVAVESAGQRDTLALAAREDRSALADPGVVTVRQLQDHLVRARGGGRGDDGIRRGVGPEAGDVLRNRALEQFDVLREIADMAA